MKSSRATGEDDQFNLKLVIIDVERVWLDALT